MTKEKRNKTMSDIILIPFLFVIDFIKHFLIGFKFVFFDVFYDIIDNFVNNSYSNKEIKNKSIAEELVQEMKEEIASRTVKKDYYRYVGTDSNGKTVKGIISATNKSTLNNFLANEGIKATSIKKDITYNLIKKMGLDTEKELKTKDLIFWLTGVSTYLKAGLTLNDTIKIMTKQVEKDITKSKLYRAISYELTLGESFSTALQNQGKVFPQLLINMIKSAEATGELIKTLDDMAEYYTEIDKTRKEMVSAIIYPTILLVFAIAVLAFIMIYVIPEFIKVYNNAGITISGFTLSIINISKFITNNINIIIVVLLISIILMLILYKNSKYCQIYFTFDEWKSIKYCIIIKCIMQL